MKASVDRRISGKSQPASPATGLAARRGSPVSDRLHPAIYWIIVGLAGWLVLSVWGFSGSGYAGLALAVVSLFILIAVAIPLLLWRIARRHPEAHPEQSDPGSFRCPLQGSSGESFPNWLGREFDANTGRMKATVAALEILLPIASVAFGMTIFALVRHFDGVL